jgi:hypothetical protein
MVLVAWMTLPFLIFLLALYSAESDICGCDSLLIHVQYYPNKKPITPCWNLAKVKATNLDTSST